MYEKKPRQRLVNVYDLERRSVVKEDGCRYVPWLAIAEAPTADVAQTAPRYCPHCGARMDGGTRNG